jgi:hypothetical protein
MPRWHLKARDALTAFQKLACKEISSTRKARDPFDVGDLAALVTKRDVSN